MASEGAVTVRVGGQALVDGVLMRSPRAWAVARTDGSIEVGSVPANRVARVPVLRVLVSLLPALGLGLKAMAGARGAMRRRGLVVLGVLAVATFASPLLPATPTPVQSIVLAAATLAALRLLAPASLWRFHGAEHKAVTAYEAGHDLDDTDAALRATRVHPRCGTNLVALIVLPLALLTHLPGALQLVAALVLLGAGAEVLALSARFPRSPLTKVLLAPGLVLQRVVTTSEPTFAEQAIAGRALAACLAAHHESAFGHSLAA